MIFATDDYVSLSLMGCLIDAKPKLDIDFSSRGTRIAPKIYPSESYVFQWIDGKSIVYG